MKPNKFNKRNRFAARFATLILTALLTSTAHADIIPTGDVNPFPTTDPYATIDPLFIGETQDATLTISNAGNLSTVEATIALNSAVTATATVTGQNATWTNSTVLFVGHSGHGTLNIQDGASLSATTGTHIGFNFNGTGIATVTDPNATFNTGSLIVGSQGHGTLNILNGAHVTNNFSTIANIRNSTGIATVDGPNSTWTNTSSINVGFQGNGTLNVQNGATLSNTFGTIAFSSDSTSTANITGPNSTWTNSGNLTVGNEGNGTLNISDGGTVTNVIGYIGNPARSNFRSIGFANVTGPNSTWTNASELFVGRVVDGTLNIQDGGNVSNTIGHIGFFVNSISSATVAGTNSIWNNSENLYIGENGQGTLNIQNGGNVLNTNGFLGLNFDATGTANIQGPGASWINSGDLIVGDLGQGTLNISNGGNVTATNSIIANAKFTNAIANVTGPNATWNNAGDLAIGESGNGILNISSGASVSNQNAFIGHLASPPEVVFGKWFSTGIVSVTGNNSTWNSSGNLFVGFNGNGTLNVDDNAAVIVTGTTTISELGEFNINGGTLSTGSFEQDTEEKLNFNSGTLTITASDYTITPTGVFGNDLIIKSNQTLNVTQQAFITPNSIVNVLGNINTTQGLNNHGNLILVDTTGTGKTLNGPLNSPAGSTVTLIGDTTFTGPVSGAGNFFGPGTATFQGGFSPGDSPATVNFESNLTLTSTNSLTIELGGTSAGIDFDQLIIGGGASLAGDLIIDLINGYIPEPGTTFEILNFDSLSGFFENIITQNAPAGLFFDFDIDELLGTATLIAQAHFPGDATLDGTVNLADLAKLATNFGSNSATWFDGDFTSDGVINLADLAKLATNFGSSITPTNLIGGASSISSLSVLGSGGAPINSIPEPNSFLILLSSLALFKKRKRKEA